MKNEFLFSESNLGTGDQLMPMSDQDLFLFLIS